MHDNINHNLLSFICQRKVDFLICSQLITKYQENQSAIEYTQANQMLNKLHEGGNNIIDNMLLLNYVTKKIIESSSMILQKDIEFSAYYDFRNQLGSDFFNFSFEKIESALQQIIIVHLKELLEQKKYKYNEEYDAARQYFINLSSIFGIDIDKLSNLVDQEIQTYLENNDIKLRSNLKKGKAAFIGLKYTNIFDINLIIKSLKKVFAHC